MSSYNLQSDYSFAGGIPEPPFKIDKSVSERIDPEYASFFEKHLIQNSNLLYTHRTPLEVTRKGGNVIPGQTPLALDVSSYDIKISRKHTLGEEIPARVFVPASLENSDNRPLFVWYHGGGHVLGNISTENSYCTKVASYSNCVVMTVDYRLAPENPFPAAVHDAFEALMFAYEKPEVLKIDNSRISVGGSSAGGNLAAIVSHKFSNFGSELPPICLQLLVVPVIDNTATVETQPSWRENEFTPQLPAEKMLWYRELYLPNSQDHDNPEASPLFYSDESFKKNPPCLIAAAACDVLRSEAEAYNVKLKKNGVNSDIIIYPGVPHPVMVMDLVLTKGKQLVQDTTRAIKEALYHT
ncbi:hypothetical protein HYPBUDRAFT_110440 [Hyphopichia burtonii NRRL Y-1933]|uniref:Alpha/beta hydrolase fold-3 domain-containing protein n=1 Tax=Hyphopichia burtonii NRRL Y-1933 TaxID=984485 RepID=A0A1E4RI00_9ASCO|nr:hypothetical protein HYPBUDRAFT_110440 [Hyphopichia burtonii NRRL Y-1933]ODV66745.1 hypothetical protein HYPBUDRAFT_110440 [Hyphopichia burtonii NRRL Y-1933]